MDEKKELEIAANNTEAVLLIGKKKHGPIIFKLDGQSIVPQGSLKYLGVVLDAKLSFAPHLSQAVEKANRVISRLSFLLPRCYGAEESKRRTLCQVALSIVLYAVEIWEKCLHVRKYRQIAERFQRRLSILINRGYRTISLESARIISRIIPLDLMVEERIRQRGTKMKRNENRKITIEKWNTRWKDYSGSSWTKQLINDVEKWYNRKAGNVTYHLTQFLSGHGCFQHYLYAIKKVDDPKCLYCGAEEDTAEHTFFICEAWRKQKEDLNKKLKQDLQINNFLDTVTKNEKENENWKHITAWVESILKQKEKDERHRQKEQEENI